jgi:hypothetical protein
MQRKYTPSSSSSSVQLPNNTEAKLLERMGRINTKYEEHSKKVEQLASKFIDIREDYNVAKSKELHNYVKLSLIPQCEENAKPLNFYEKWSIENPLLNVLPTDILKLILNEMSFLDMINFILTSKEMTNHVCSEKVNIYPIIYSKFRSTESIRSSTIHNKELVKLLDTNENVIKRNKNGVIHLLLILHFMTLLENNMCIIPFHCMKYNRNPKYPDSTTIRLDHIFIKGDNKTSSSSSYFLSDGLKRCHTYEPYYFSSHIFRCEDTTSYWNVYESMNERLTTLNGSTSDDEEDDDNKSMKYLNKFHLKKILKYNKRICRHVNQHELSLLALSKAKGTIKLCETLVYFRNKDEFQLLHDSYIKNAYVILDGFGVYKLQQNPHLQSQSITDTFLYDRLETYMRKRGSVSHSSLKNAIDMKVKDIRHNIECLIKRCDGGGILKRYSTESSDKEDEEEEEEEEEEEDRSTPL